MMEWCLQEAAVLLEQTVALLCHKNILLAQLHTSRLPQKKNDGGNNESYSDTLFL